MKIGCMTWFHYCNYGTALQVTALSKYLESKGHTPQVINYISTSKIRTRRINSVLKTVKNYTKSYYYKTYCTEGVRHSFESFLDKNIHLSEKANDFSDLRCLASKYDAVICGSDQIWSPLNYNPHYFLDFVEDENKMIAYAPSIGVSKIEDKDILENMSHLVDRFKYISCREKIGAHILSELKNAEVNIVCDPTFLLDSSQWRLMESNRFSSYSKRYLLVYFLGQNEKYWDYIYTIASLLQLDVKIIPVFKKDLNRKGCVLDINIGPAEFLELIDNAAFLCTDSFHGTAFAINFQVPFITFERFINKQSGNQNSRIYNILEFTGLEDRLFSVENYKTIVMNEIDFLEVQHNVDNYKGKSEEYLQGALKSIEFNQTIKIDRFNPVSSTLCCGCGSCSVVCPKECISIGENEEGFLCVQVDMEKCINCGKCRTVCPFYCEKKKKSASDAFLYSYKDFSNAVLKSSSSGGAAYRLSKYLMKKGYAIVGCVYDKSIAHCKHILIKPNEVEKLRQFQGSKYLQSMFCDVLHEIKHYSDPIAIFGTPCQIAGAKKLFSSRTNIIYIDLICHGIPSYLLFSKYLEHMSSKYTLNIRNSDVNFRLKTKGWRNRYISVSDGTKQIIAHQDKDLFFSSFELGQIYSHTCYECRWRDDSAADIRLGDYWLNKFKNDNTGVSMVIAYTDIGNNIVNNLKKYGTLHIENSDDYYACQQSKNVAKPVYHQTLLKELKNPQIELSTIYGRYMKKEMKRRMIGKKISPIMRCIVKYAKKQ